MGLHVPPNVARAGRHASTLGGAAVWLCVLYIAITSIFTSWLGAAFWTPYLVGLAWLFWRQFKDIRRRKLFDAHLNAEQLSIILNIRRIVEDVEAHTEVKRNWIGFFTRQYWVPTELPTKPSLAEIEAALRESEDAVGTFDINIREAINKLMLASQAQKDLELEGKVIVKYIRFIENTKGKDHEVLIRFVARAGQLHFVQNEYEKSAEELTRALELNSQHQRKNPNSRGLMNHHLFMFCRKILAMAYATAKNSEAAEPICIQLLADLEQEEGMLNTELLGTQMVRGMLIEVYIRQGRKALNSVEVENPASIVSRYLRDALSLIAIHPSFQAHNLKQVGRLFIWGGRTADGHMAFKLANTIYKAGKQSGTPQRNCLCSAVENETHGLRTCDDCSKAITLSDRWFFCLTCADADLCVECYEEFDKAKGVNVVESVSKKCFHHEFYEVREDEYEESVSVQEWIMEMIQRLNVETRHRE